MYIHTHTHTHIHIYIYILHVHTSNPFCCAQPLFSACVRARSLYIDIWYRYVDATPSRNPFC